MPRKDRRYLKHSEPLDYLKVESFPESLNQPKEPSQPEGSFIILDEDKVEVTQCAALTDLPLGQQYLIAEGLWSFQKNNQPLNASKQPNSKAC